MSKESDALLEAIQTRDVDRVAALLAAGADPNEPGKSRYGSGGDLPPLHAAIAELEAFGEDEPGGPIDAVILLLRHGARVNGWDIDREGDPLFDAVLMKHIEAVRLLVAAGADPNVQDNEGDSPLRFCADKGYLEMARLLLLSGATKTIHEAGGSAGMNALGLAAYALNVGIVRLLLAHGADPLVEDNDRRTPLDRLRRLSPTDPADQERLREIRRLLGDPPA
jgi:hypothetical protein